MTVSEGDLQAIRTAIAALPADVSTDAVGLHAPRLDDLYAPESHAAALDPVSPIVLGARGTGKSFWAGTLGNIELREAAAKAYPKLGLTRLDVQFGYTGLDGPEGIGRDRLNQCVPQDADLARAKTFFWATILRAVHAVNGQKTHVRDLLADAGDVDLREDALSQASHSLQAKDQLLLVIYDALDTMATSWQRRRLLTQALLEVVWSMRAYRTIRVKLFLRPDQLDDDGLQFVELPKLRTGAVRLTWSGTDLYGLLFARLSLGEARDAFANLLAAHGLPSGSQEEILERRWSPGYSSSEQQLLMTALCGPYMADGPHGYKKGKTYDWSLKHLADALDEVTPRSFLSLMIAAAKHGQRPAGRALTPRGIHHGLRVASKTRVDQLHQEFPWIKGVLKPLAGLLLPKEETIVFQVWKQANTLAEAMNDAQKHEYMAPVENISEGERGLYRALEHIGVMMRRRDDRIDMPDLFRVAAKLLKKGGTAPL